MTGRKAPETKRICMHEQIIAKKDDFSDLIRLIEERHLICRCPLDEWCPHKNTKAQHEWSLLVQHLKGKLP